MDQIITDLSNDLKARVEAVVQLTEQREELETKLAIAKRDLKRVQIALEALNGNEIPLPLRSKDGNAIPLPSVVDDTPDNLAVVSVSAPPVPEPRVLPPPATPARGPTCTSCGSGQMIYTARSLNNGKTVNLWLCSECRNEKF
jgi:hypothetical protein